MFLFAWSMRSQVNSGLRSAFQRTFTYGMQILSRAISGSYRFVYKVRVPNGFYQGEWDTKSDVGQTLIKSKKWLDLR